MEVKDDSRSGKPSTCRTEINVVWVRKLVSGDRWFTVQTIITKDLAVFEKKRGLGVSSIRLLLAVKRSPYWWPLYLLDIAPYNFFLFPKLKWIIKKIHFEDVETIKRAVTTELRSILEEYFQQCMEGWENASCLRRTTLTKKTMYFIV